MSTKSLALAVIEPAGERAGIERIDHLLAGEPALAGQRHAPAGRRVDFRDRMRIRVDAEKTAELDAAPVPAPIEVEPPGIAVDLDRYPVLGACRQDPLYVELVSRPAQQLPPGQVPDHVDEGIGDGAQHPLGLRLPLHAELAVDAADDEIEAAQNVVRIIERAVRQDVGLDPLENAEAAVESGIEAVDLGVLRRDLLDRKAARVMRRLRMIGDADVAISAAARRLGHLRERVDPVGGVGVGMQDAPYV